jgi:diacylglycerol kinase (ATP)
MTTRPTQPDAYAATNPQKSRKGFERLKYAFWFSIDGLRYALTEPAFRLEVWFAAVMLPAAWWVGRNWMEVSVLSLVVVIVLLCELLNIGVERAIDRIGPELHHLSKAAKDVGSAAVFLACILAIAVWAAAVYFRFFK